MDNKAPVVKNSIPVPKPYIGKRGIFGTLSALLIGGLMKNPTAIPTPLGLPVEPTAPTKPHRTSGAVRQRKARAKIRRNIQAASRKANRRTKGNTKRKYQQ